MAACPAVAGPYEDSVAAFQRGDYTTAFQILKPMADGGDARSQYTVGALYAEVKAVQKNYSEAAKWFRRSAEQGFAGGQYGLPYTHPRGGKAFSKIEARRERSPAKKKKKKKQRHKRGSWHAGPKAGSSSKSNFRPRRHRLQSHLTPPSRERQHSRRKSGCSVAIARQMPSIRSQLFQLF